MRKKTQVPARIITGYRTPELKAEIENMFYERYEEFRKAYISECTTLGEVASCQEIQRIAWRDIEIELFGGFES